MSKNYDKIRFLKAIETNIVMKIKLRRMWTNWGGIDTYEDAEPMVYIRDDGAKVKDNLG